MIKEKHTGLQKSHEGRHIEYDYWEMLAYENLDNKKKEYLLKQKSD